MSESMKRKLIEVALPLEAINVASRRDKEKKTGTIRNVHKWFAPMPAPVWRALLFATLINDPDNDLEREELLRFTAQLVPEDGGSPRIEVLREAKQRLLVANGGELPTVLDPFCGGGSTLIEAQRLGLDVVGSDLNPVAALISRTLVEMVPKVTGRPPVSGHPQRLPWLDDASLAGFVTDVTHYADAIRGRVVSSVGTMYPQRSTGEQTVAWLWARTFVCSNPACLAVTPLVSSFWLMRRGAEGAWIEPVATAGGRGVQFEVRSGRGQPREGTVARTAAKCVVCNHMSTLDYVREQGRAGRLGVQLMATVVDTRHGRRYLAPSDDEARAAAVPGPTEVPDLALPTHGLGFRVQAYGFRRFAELFTNRQLALLSAFAEEISKVEHEVIRAGGDQDYARVIASVLGLCLGKLARANCTLATWNARATGSSKAEPAFSRQTVSMVWDYTEVNPFGDSVGSWLGQVDATCRGLGALPSLLLDRGRGLVLMHDARTANELLSEPGLVATDPPYFAQVGYADLADFFYLWLRPALRGTHPDLFATVATPKQQELIADPGRHNGDRAAAARYFVEGFTRTFANLAKASRSDLPLLVIYAHSQEDTGESDSMSAWEAMLTAIMQAGLCIVGTWPVHATRSARQRSQSSNAIASYIVLICRPQPAAIASTTRRDFLQNLREELPAAVATLKRANIAPVDLAQSAIGPGMAVFTRFREVVEADGSAMRVGVALSLINDTLAEILGEGLADVDPETRFAMAWFEEFGFHVAEYGVAEKLFRAKGTSAAAVQQSAIAVVERGKVRLLRPTEMAPGGGGPDRPCVWRLTQRLVHAHQSSGERGAAGVLDGIGRAAEASRELAYGLYTVCERRGWAADALPYNALVVAWPEIARLASAPKPAAQPFLEMAT